jgi:hypothetical protein
MPLRQLGQLRLGGDRLALPLRPRQELPDRPHVAVHAVLRQRLPPLPAAGQQHRREPVEGPLVQHRHVVDPLVRAPGQEDVLQGEGIGNVDSPRRQSPRPAAGQVVVDQAREQAGRRGLYNPDCGHLTTPFLGPADGAQIVWRQYAQSNCSTAFAWVNLLPIWRRREQRFPARQMLLLSSNPATGAGDGTRTRDPLLGKQWQDPAEFS